MRNQKISVIILMSILVLSDANSAYAAMSRITAQDKTSTGSTSITATYPGATIAGDLLIAAISDNGADTGQSIPTGWTRMACSEATAVSNEICVYYKKSDGTETSVTSSDAGAGVMIMGIYEYSGYSNPILDQATGDNCGPFVGCSSLSSGSVTTQSANEVLFTAAYLNGPSSSISWSNSFTAVSTITNGSPTLYTAERIVSTTGSYSTTLSWTGTSFASIVIGAFKDNTSKFQLWALSSF